MNWVFACNYLNWLLLLVRILVKGGLNIHQCDITLSIKQCYNDGGLYVLESSLLFCVPFVSPLCPQWAADAAVLRPSAPQAEPGSAPQAPVPSEAPAQGQEGSSPHGEARGGQDPPERHGHPARDGWIHGRRVQWKDLQPGWNQGETTNSSGFVFVPFRVLLMVTKTHDAHSTLPHLGHKDRFIIWQQNTT